MDLDCEFLARIFKCPVEYNNEVNYTPKICARQESILAEKCALRVIRNGPEEIFCSSEKNSKHIVLWQLYRKFGSQN